MSNEEQPRSQLANEEPPRGQLANEEPARGPQAKLGLVKSLSRSRMSSDRLSRNVGQSSFFDFFIFPFIKLKSIKDYYCCSVLLWRIM
jgi:hypothetical protein